MVWENSGSPWTPERDARLAKLWAEGMSAAKIGEDMQITKNAVIGRRRRLNLPTRGSPISTRIGREPSKPAHVVPLVTLPVLESIKPVTRQPDHALSQNGYQRTERMQIGGRAQSSIPPQIVAVSGTPSTRWPHCQYIYNTGRPWIWCDQPAHVGPYCAAHHRLCHAHVAQGVDVVPWLGRLSAGVQT